MNDRPALTDADERLLALLREHSIDAEVAVRLGVSVGDVKERIARLQAKVGVTSRAELVALRLPGTRAERSPEDAAVPDDVPAPGEETEVIDFTGRAGHGPPPGMPRQRSRAVSRRNFLMYAVNGTVALGGLATIGYLATPGGREVPGAAPTATPSPTPPVDPLGGPLTGLDFRLDADGTVVAKSYAANERIPAEAALCLMDVSTGEVTAYSLADGAGGPQQASPAHSLLTFSGEARHTFHHLASGTTVSVDARRWRTLATGDEAVALINWSDAARREIAIVRPALDPNIISFEVPGDVRPGDISGLAGPDGLLAFAWTEGTNVHLATVDARSGQAARAPYGSAKEQSSAYLTRTGDGNLILASSEGDRWVVRAFNWDRDLMAGPVPIGGAYWLAGIAGANHDLLVVQQMLHVLQSQGIGGPVGYVATTVLDQYGQPEYRVRSLRPASPGVNPERLWLHPGRERLVCSRPAPSGEPFAEIFSILDITRGTVEALAPPWPGIPIPSPHDPELFAIGNSAAWNRRTGHFVAANPEGGVWGDDPWGISSTLAFMTPISGRDGPGAWIMPPPVVEYPPFGERMRFRVARTNGDGLALRANPGGEVIGGFPDGTEVELVNPSEEGLNDAEPTHAFADDEFFVLVRSDDGRQGWVAQRYLDWAMGEPLLEVIA